MLNSSFVYVCLCFEHACCRSWNEYFRKCYPTGEIPMMDLNVFRTAEVNFLCLKYLYICCLFEHEQISILPLSLWYIFLPSRICINRITFNNVLANRAMIFSIFSPPFAVHSTWSQFGLRRDSLAQK